MEDNMGGVVYGQRARTESCELSFDSGTLFEVHCHVHAVGVEVRLPSVVGTADTRLPF